MQKAKKTDVLQREGLKQFVLGTVFMQTGDAQILHFRLCHLLSSRAVCYHFHPHQHRHAPISHAGLCISIPQRHLGLTCHQGKKESPWSGICCQRTTTWTITARRQVIELNAFNSHHWEPRSSMPGAVHNRGPCPIIYKSKVSKKHEAEIRRAYGPVQCTLKCTDSKRA